MKVFSLWQRLHQTLMPQASTLPRAPSAVDAVAKPAPAAPPEPADDPLTVPLPYKQLRAERREQLYALLRETMLRAGILSTAYSCRVLTLDREGEHFVVLCNLEGTDVDTSHGALNAIERRLQQLTWERHPHLQVKRIYWHVDHPETPETRQAPDSVPPVDFAPTQPMTHDFDSERF